VKSALKHKKSDCTELGLRRQATDQTKSSGEVNSLNPSRDTHLGTVASGDMVMGPGSHRDKVAKRKNVIAFEMEGAGLWDSLLTIVIKGVRDYADSHKGRSWKPYAAASAAVCMKAFLTK
jgi:nucleoside phosphorylase